MEERTNGRTVQRRTVLKALGVSTISVGAFAAPVGARGRGGTGFTEIGVNKFDGDVDGAIDVSVEQEQIPGEGRVAHITSNGNPTGDYATSVVNVGRIALGDIETLTYDYYGGENNTVSAPDEVWLLVEDSSGEMHTVYRASNDGNPSAQSWKTREVHREIEGDPEHNLGYNWFEVTTSGTSRLAESLIDEFSGDADLLRVGAGRGSFGGSDVLDVYYDGLSVNGAGRGQFPTE